MKRCQLQNGFTVLEMLLVLLAASLLAALTVSARQAPLSLFMKDLENRIVLQQVQAYAQNEPRFLAFTEHSLITPSATYVFPEGIACTPFSWHYTRDGTISAGGTVTCRNQDQTVSLVFRIGAGRLAIRRE